MSVVPVMEHLRNVSVGDDMDQLLEPASPRPSEVFWGDQLDNHTGQGVKGEEAREGH